MNCTKPRLINHTALITLAILVSALLFGCTTAPKKVETDTPMVEESPQMAIKPAPDVDLEQVEREYRKALSAMKNDDFPLALERLTRMIKRYPGFSGPHVNLGIIYLKQKKLDLAEKHLKHAIKINPENRVAYNQLGIVLRNKGQFKASLTHYHKALKVDPDYAMAHLNIGILLDLYLAQPQKALKHYEQYQKLTKSSQQQVDFWIVDLKQRLGASQHTGGNI